MKVANIQRFCMHDGPGVRTTVFLKGCPLRCAWCHNPETQRTATEILFYESKCIMCAACGSCPLKAHSFGQKHLFDRDLCVGCGMCTRVCPTGALELCGIEYSAEALLEIIRKDSVFYGDSGGVTVSGGEPFLQSDEVMRLFSLCREGSINTAVETCGCFSPDVLKKAVPLVDLFLWDIKDTDPERHRKYVGVDNKIILENLSLADSLGAKMRIRFILVNGVNTHKEHYENVLNIVRDLKHCEGVEFMPYHSYGGSKALALGEENNGNDSWIPTAEQVAEAKGLFSENGIKVF